MRMPRGAHRKLSLVGTDEVNLNWNHISWASPLGRALIKAADGDQVVLHALGGTETLTVLEVRFELISVEPFRELPGLKSRKRKRDSPAGC
jgi:transcription elongation factor GreB